MARSGDSYQRFIRTARSVARRELAEKALPVVLDMELRQLLDDVLQRLLSQEAIVAIESAWENLDTSVADLLIREIDFISALNTDDGDSSGSDDVSTGKESLEDILGEWLPKWLKHLLKLLNEILKLVRPFS